MKLSKLKVEIPSSPPSLNTGSMISSSQEGDWKSLLRRI
jgi:hypothetical protein